MQSPVENPSPLTDVCGLDLTQPMLFTVPGILTPTECLGFIARIEAGQPTPAPITTHRGPIMRPDVRNNSRVLLDDPRLAAEFYDRRFATGVVCPPMRVSALRITGGG